MQASNYIFFLKCNEQEKKMQKLKSINKKIDVEKLEQEYKKILNKYEN